MSTVTRDDAFLMLDKWRSEGALISCEVRFSLGKCRKVGRIAGMTSDGFAIRADDDVPDRADDFLILVPPSGAFLYGEPREGPTAAISILVILESKSSPVEIRLGELI